MSSLRPQIAESVSPVQYQTVQLNDESKGVFKGENNESKAQMSHSCEISFFLRFSKKLRSVTHSLSHSVGHGLLSL